MARDRCRCIELLSLLNNRLDSANGNGFEGHSSSSDSSPDIVIDEFEKSRIETLMKVEQSNGLNPEKNDDNANLSHMEPIP